MKTITISVYEYDELSPSAQAKARDWFRECLQGDNSFADTVIDDAQAIAPLIGIDIAHRNVRFANGKSFQEPAIFYSGFSSQGDGACFEGTWRADSVKLGELREYAPKDETLHQIASEFERIARAFPGASFSVKHRGNYSHEGCTEFDFSLVPDYDGVMDPADEKRIDIAEGELKETAKSFMRWIYKQLETEYEYDQSDENIAENIRANEYGFTEEGKRTATV